MEKREDIVSKILEIIDNNLIDVDIVLTEDVNLKYDLNIDSMTLVRIILDISDSFNIEIQSNDINDNNFLTINHIVNFVKGKI